MAESRRSEVKIVMAEGRRLDQPAERNWSKTSRTYEFRYEVEFWEDATAFAGRQGAGD